MIVSFFQNQLFERQCFKYFNIFGSLCFCYEYLCTQEEVLAHITGCRLK